MKYLVIAPVYLLIWSSNLYSQSNIDNVLIEIEKNNTTLLALQKNTEAEKIGNKTGIYPQNPEVEFNYLWGSPSSIGNRTDISISQTFDFPTAYSYRNQISNYRNEQVELEYQKQRKSILLQSRLVCIDLVYTNAFIDELSKRLFNAKSVANSYKSKFEIGETNILEYNKAQLNLLNLTKEIENVKIERNLLLSELTGLNGGNSIEFKESVFQSPIIPVDFEQWYIQAAQSNPVLKWLKQEVEVSLKQEKLNVVLSLPKFQAGYRSENVVREQFQGIIVGISIPIWENKNTIKFSKAKTIAVQSIESDQKNQFYNELKALHTKAINLQKITDDYRNNLTTFDNSVLLKKALDKGEITMIYYILELSIYYESINKLLELEKEMNKTLAAMNQFL